MYREKCRITQTCASGRPESGEKIVFEGSISRTGTLPLKLTLSSAMYAAYNWLLSGAPDSEVALKDYVTVTSFRNCVPAGSIL